MGLFNKKHHDEPTVGTGATGTGYDNTTGTGLTGTHGHHSVGTGTGATGTGVGGTYDRDYATSGTNTGYTGTGATDTGLGHHHHRRDDEYNTTGAGVTGGTGLTGAHTGAGLTGPHTGTEGYTGTGTTASGAARGAATHGGGSGKALEGKIEKGLGTIIGSSTLKAKGLEKEREAEALKVQAAELQTAEGYEHQATQARTRAVAAGAPEHHRHLGGIANPAANPATHETLAPGEQMGHQPGFGPGTGGNPLMGGVGQARGSAL